VHEIKHDGYRLIVRRDGLDERLFTRNGYDRTDRYPAIACAASKLKSRTFTLDGEAVVCGPDGIACSKRSNNMGRCAKLSRRHSTCWNSMGSITDASARRAQEAPCAAARSRE
jgi:ATP-dependent DNA ligase